MLRTEDGSSARTANTLNCQATFTVLMPFLIMHKYKIIEACVVDGGMLEKHDSRDDIDNMLTPERLTKLEFKDAPLEESV